MAGRRSSSYSKSRSRSPSKSASRSRSRSSASSRSSRSHSRSRRSRSRTPYDKNRLHISDIGWGITKRDLERVFERYGRLVEVWQSRTVPAFAFVVFRKDEDAADALKATDGMTIHGSRIRVSFARPRAYERRRVGPISTMRCYSCNRKGHFSRDCPDSMYGYRRPPSRFGSSGRVFRSPLTRRYRSRGRSASRSRSHSRDRSHRRDSRRRDESYSPDRKRRRSTSSKERKERKRHRSDSREPSKSKKNASPSASEKSHSPSVGRARSRSASIVDKQNNGSEKEMTPKENSLSPAGSPTKRHHRSSSSVSGASRGRGHSRSSSKQNGDRSLRSASRSDIDDRRERSTSVAVADHSGSD